MHEATERPERIECSTEFCEKHLRHRDGIRVASEASNVDLFTAHTMVFSAVASYQSRLSAVRLQISDERVKAQSVLIAQFIQNIEITKTAISEGLYAAAANLLKQALETIDVIDAYEHGMQKDGKLPGFKLGLKSFGRKYGELNEIVHPTRQEIVAGLSIYSEGEKIGPTVIPQINTKLCGRLIGHHALLIVEALRCMRRLFTNEFGLPMDEAETHLAMQAIKILEKEGICKVGVTKPTARPSSA